ncbi:MAG TPA: DNA helicase RecG, partial [Vicinamibacteria bacterium]
MKGIGPARAERLERLGVRAIGDALLLVPRRYEDRRTFAPIGRLRPGDVASVLGEVKSVGMGRTRRGIPFCEILVEDRTGSLPVRWYRQPYLAHAFRRGLRIILTGRLTPYPPRYMVNPEHEVEEAEEIQYHSGRIVPVYPLTAGLAQRFLRRLLFDLARTVGPRLP